MKVPMKSLLNCAPILAIVVGGLTAAAPASASYLKLNPKSISASHDMLSAKSLSGEVKLSARYGQQQQQQQRRFVGDRHGLVYEAPLSGFDA
jgi:hypothetical protein